MSGNFSSFPLAGFLENTVTSFASIFKTFLNNDSQHDDVAQPFVVSRRPTRGASFFSSIGHGSFVLHARDSLGDGVRHFVTLHPEGRRRR
jgi:hypothetical protein